MDDRPDPVETARRFVAARFPAARLAAALRRVAVEGDRAPLDTVAREVLHRAGGPLLEGYRLAAELPA
jgi:hypothetical protein